jgi:hypothetical protein
VGPWTLEMDRCVSVCMFVVRVDRVVTVRAGAAWTLEMAGAFWVIRIQCDSGLNVE